MDLVRFSEEILNGKLYFLCSKEMNSEKKQNSPKNIYSELSWKEEAKRKF